MAMVSNKGKAQVFSRKMESFTLENMHVDQIIFCGADWVGFLGHRNSKRETTDVTCKSKQEKQQFLEIFSQKNIAICLHSIKAEEGSRMTDVAV